MIKYVCRHGIDKAGMEMKEETKKELGTFEEKNERIFQVMGSLKLLNNKVKTFVKRLEKVQEDDDEKQKQLNQAFRELYREIQFFQEEHRRFEDLGLHVPSVDTFASNAHRLFPKQNNNTYTILEMRRISVYIYRMADLMLKELKQQKQEYDQQIHALQAKSGKYYFNRK